MIARLASFCFRDMAMQLIRSSRGYGRLGQFISVLEFKFEVLGNGVVDQGLEFGECRVHLIPDGLLVSCVADCGDLFGDAL